MTTPRRAGDAMTPAVTCPADTSVRRVALAMLESGADEVLVTREGGLLGIVTTRDVVVRAVAPGADVDTTVAGQICSDAVMTVNADTPVDTVASVLAGSSVHRLPVLDGQWPVGVVSLDSVIGPAPEDV